MNNRYEEMVRTRLRDTMEYLVYNNMDITKDELRRIFDEFSIQLRRLIASSKNKKPPVPQKAITTLFEIHNACILELDKGRLVTDYYLVKYRCKNIPRIKICLCEYELREFIRHGKIAEFENILVERKELI